MKVVNFTIVFRETKSALRDPKEPPSPPQPASSANENGYASVRKPNFALFLTPAPWGPTRPSLYNETTLELSKLAPETIFRFRVL